MGKHTMQTLHVLSGGAAQGLVRASQAEFEKRHALTLDCTFNAVGAIQQKLLEGAACDVLILTRPLIDALMRSGVVADGTARDLGTVKTGVAVKAGAVHPDVNDANALRAALSNASGIYFPDPQLATAGIHVMKVISALGLADKLADRLRPYPNGNSAMKAMAESTDMQAIGSTQITEIRITPGVEFVADLPKEFELATVYTAAVCSRSQHAKAAQDFIAVLTGDSRADARTQAGFLHSQI
jgi:molybdate transport system substrate-binding protein